MSYIYCSKCRQVVRENEPNNTTPIVREVPREDKKPLPKGSGRICALDSKIERVRGYVKTTKEILSFVRALCPENLISEYDYYLYSMRRIPPDSKRTLESDDGTDAKSSRIQEMSSMLQSTKPTRQRNDVKQSGEAILNEK